MKRAGLTISLALVVFIAVLIAYLPVSWLRSYLPANVTCQDLAGSVWDGQCLGLGVAQAQLGDVSWDISGWRALTGRLVGQVSIARRDAAATADVSVSLGGDGELTNLKARLPIDPSLAAAIPANYRGDVLLDFARVAFAKQRLTTLKGVASVRGLRQVGAQPMNLGSYDATFDSTAAQDGSLTGTLADRGGPLALAGTIKITSEPGYELNGTVTARAEAAPGLRRQIEFLGMPDASGARPFSVAGTL